MRNAGFRSLWGLHVVKASKMDKGHNIGIIPNNFDDLHLLH